MGWGGNCTSTASNYPELQNHRPTHVRVFTQVENTMLAAASTANMVGTYFAPYFLNVEKVLPVYFKTKVSF